MRLILQVGYPQTGLTTPVGWLVTPTDRPKSVRNRCVIEVFGSVCVLSFDFRIFCWYRGICHRTGSDLFLFLFAFVFPVVFRQCMNPVLNMCYVHTAHLMGSNWLCYFFLFYGVYVFSLPVRNSGLDKQGLAKIRMNWAVEEIPRRQSPRKITRIIALICHLSPMTQSFYTCMNEPFSFIYSHVPSTYSNEKGTTTSK